MGAGWLKLKLWQPFDSETSGDAFVAVWIFASAEQRDASLALLKCSACPHCKNTGTLNRHGFLKGYDEQNFKQKAFRAIRVFCSNRSNAGGCGRTFRVWIAEKVKRLFIDAKRLWQFLEHAATTGNKSQAFQKLSCSLSESATYRIWERFRLALSAIRTKLVSLCPPPKQSNDNRSQSPAQATIEHLKEAFKTSMLNPVAAFQAHTQSFFI